MKRLWVLGVVLLGCLPCQTILAAEVTGTFTVKQSKGLDLSEGDKVTVRVLIKPGAPGVKERGMAGSPQIRFKGVVTEVSIDTPTKDFTIPCTFDVIVMPLRKQWVGGGGKPVVNTKSDQPQIEMFTFSLEYPEGVLGEESLIPPEGGMPAKKARTFTAGIDLLVIGRLEYPGGEEWSVAGELISYEVAK